VTVDDVGLMCILTFPNEGGNLGPINLDPSLKAPSGIGLAIAGGGISGGGSLSTGPGPGEYSGTLELVFQDEINLKAYGVLSTRLPDGQEGFSLVIIITAEFQPVQLGFGFKLAGVGGLLGVNRTVLYEPLRNGIGDGSLESILFPRDVVARAPQLIADLNRIFPPEEGTFLIGPMVKLEWGTPTVLKLKAGIVLETSRAGLAVLGVLTIVLPTEEAEILKLQVNFVATVDFEARKLTFDGTLYESRVLSFPLSGDMAVRAYWGDNANFLLSAGGFHPAYTPPPLDLPAQIDRLSVVVFSGNPDVRAEAYFAVTSNTVQFGGRLELRADAWEFNIYGFLALDVLVQIDPFHFVAQIGAMLAVRAGSEPILSVRLALMLEGPAPWHAKGRGSFEISFIFTVEVSVGFDVTFGDERTAVLAPIVPLDEVAAALSRPEAWQALPSRTASLSVSLRELPAAGAELVLLPTSSLGARQKVAPLNVRLARIGARRVTSGDTVSIMALQVGTESMEPEPLREEFAPAQYFDLSDAEKLSSRSFKPYVAGGAARASNTPRASFVRSLDVVYELSYVPVRRPKRLFQFARGLFDRFLFTSAAARSALGVTNISVTGVGTPRVEVPGERYTVVRTRDLGPFDSGRFFATEEEAGDALARIISNDPSQTGRLQVVPEFEAVA
jgi:hypothetical protein